MNNKKHLSQPWFNYIKSGEKTIEGRLNKDFWKDLNIDDIIIWYNNDKNFKTKVIKKNIYKSFRDYLSNEDLNKCLPNINNIDDGLNIYYQYYNKDDTAGTFGEKKYGIVALHLELCD